MAVPGLAWRWPTARVVARPLLAVPAKPHRQECLCPPRGTGVPPVSRAWARCPCHGRLPEGQPTWLPRRRLVILSPLFRAKDPRSSLFTQRREKLPRSFGPMNGFGPQDDKGVLRQRRAAEPQPVQGPHHRGHKGHGEMLFLCALCTTIERIPHSLYKFVVHGVNTCLVAASPRCALCGDFFEVRNGVRPAARPLAMRKGSEDVEKFLKKHFTERRKVAERAKKT